MIARITLLTLIFAVPGIYAAELEPRRWAHTPVDTNFVGVGYVHTEGEIAFDPVLQIEGAEVELDATVLKYIRTFEMFEKSAKISLAQAQVNATWSGLLGGVPTSAQRVGLSDTVARFAIQLKGAPPLKGKAYQQYRASKDVETIIGAGLVVHLPTGEYKEDKLLNLGGNRYVVRPQFGVTHKRRNWTAEMTASAFIYTENDDFFGGNKLEQDPLYSVQGHLMREFKGRKWVSLSFAWGRGGEVEINGIEKNDVKEELLWAVSFGAPLSPRIGMKIAYLDLGRREPTGIEGETLLVSLSTFF
jgi:hypothetical protein